MKLPERVCFVDVETTTDSPLTGHLWEIGLIVREPWATIRPDCPEARAYLDGEYWWLVEPPSMEHAQTTALRIGRYYQRTKGCTWADPRETARTFAALTADAAFVAKNPAFDAGFLDKFLRANGQAPAWDYRLVDIGSLYLGWLAGQRHLAGQLPDTVPWDDPHGLGLLKTGPPLPESTSLSEITTALGLDLSAYQIHEALSDARQVRDIWDLIKPYGAGR